MPNVQLKRVYQAADPADGKRVLVDRLWPRGMTKAEAKVDLWLKEVGPSADLRRWFGHKPERWAEFRRRYREELKGNSALNQLEAIAAEGRTTLVYGAKDQAHNQAVVLAELLQAKP